MGCVVAYAGLILEQDAAGGLLTTDIEAQGWLLCDGRLLQVAQYPELHDVIGFLCGGAGDSFNLPDYRGQFFRGVATKDQDPGFDQRTPPQGGQKGTVGSTQGYMVQLHEHNYEFYTGTAPAQEGQPEFTPAPAVKQTTGLFDAEGRDISKEATETRPSPCLTILSNMG